jgi:hypothetical protein
VVGVYVVLFVLCVGVISLAYLVGISNGKHLGVQIGMRIERENSTRLIRRCVDNLDEKISELNKALDETNRINLKFHKMEEE